MCMQGFWKNLISLRSPETTQVIKFQKIAQEQARCLRQTRVELDQEKAESEYLKQEVERLKKDRDGVRSDHQRTKFDFLLLGCWCPSNLPAAVLLPAQEYLDAAGS